MELARLIAAWALACAGFFVVTSATLALTRDLLIAFAASRLGQHQGESLRNHAEGR